MTVLALLLARTDVFAQVYPVLNTFSNRDFEGTVDVSWPVMFEGCDFVTDSIVISHSYGAVFRNCTFESRSGVLYLAGSGDGMILADCDIKGCAEFKFSPVMDRACRNYVSGVTVGSNEYVIPDDQEEVIDMDGTMLRDIIDGKQQGPMFLRMNPQRISASPHDTVSIRLMGLSDGMFAGWRSSDRSATVKVDGPFACSVAIPDGMSEVTVFAYTEYGLEAACVIDVKDTVVQVKQHGWFWRLFHRNKR